MPLFRLLVLACPVTGDELLRIRLEELAIVIVLLFPATLLLTAAIVVGLRSARELSRDSPRSEIGPLGPGAHASRRAHCRT